MAGFKAIIGREVSLVCGRGEYLSIIDADVPVRTLNGVHRWRYVSQHWRLVDLSADADPKRQYQTGCYSDVGALYESHQTNKHTYNVVPSSYKTA